MRLDANAATVASSGTTISLHRPVSMRANINRLPLEAIGVDIPGDLIVDAGGQIVTTVQAAGGLIGTLMAIVGRMRASLPLERRQMSIRL